MREKNLAVSFRQIVISGLQGVTGLWYGCVW